MDQAETLPALAQVRVGSWLLVVFMATMATGGQLLMLQALRRAPLSLLTPFSYGQLAFAAFFSWLLFGQVPDMWMAIGMCVIAASGIGTVLMHGRKPAPSVPTEI
jgi:drug/metabolite transporter (DMT)-like permease